MNNKVLAVIVLTVAVAAGFLIQRMSTEDEAPAVAEASLTRERIEFTLSDVNGVQRNLSDWQGEARLVNFWATWCAPCRREIPLLKALQDDKDNSGLQVIGIAVDFVEDVAAYAEDAEFNYPILVGQEDAMAAAEASGVDFIGLPFTLVISKEGDLVNAHMGEIREAHIERIVTVMQQLDAGSIDLSSAREQLHSL